MEVVELVGAVDRDWDAGGHHDRGCDRFANEAGGAGEAAPGVFDARAAGLQGVGGIGGHGLKCTDGSGLDGDHLNE